MEPTERGEQKKKKKKKKKEEGKEKNTQMAVIDR